MEGLPSKQSDRSKSRQYSYNSPVAKVLRVDCASENKQIVKNGFYLINETQVDIQEELQSSINNSIHYHYNHRFPVLKRKTEGVCETNFNVVNCGAIQAAMDVHNSFKSSATTSTSSTIDSITNHIGILNFASAKNPGGGYLRGASAQEESLCRSSLLYPCLHQYEDIRDHYYQINRGKRNDFGTFYSNCAIFSPLVPIIRDDSPSTFLLEEKFLASFVTSPAPNKSALIQQHKNGSKPGKRNKKGVETNVLSSTENKQLQKVMVQRIKTILNIFEVNRCTDLILGAFGCGVFGNDPGFVSAVFHHVIRKEYKGVFRSVTFAIWTPPKCVNPMEDPNYSAFMNEFSTCGEGS